MKPVFYRQTEEPVAFTEFEFIVRNDDENFVEGEIEKFRELYPDFKDCEVTYKYAIIKVRKTKKN